MLIVGLRAIGWTANGKIQGNDRTDYGRKWKCRRSVGLVLTRDDAEDTGETIYLYGNDFVDYIAPKFTEETGFKLEAVHYGGGEALAKIEAEQGNPQWDVLMMDGHGSVRNLADRDFPLTDWEPENLGNLSESGRSYVPEDLSYFPVGIHAAGVIAYNTTLVTPEKAPTTWEQFLLMTALWVMQIRLSRACLSARIRIFEQWGVETAEQKYEQRFKAGLHVYPKNGPVGKALLSGEIEVAALQEHNAYELKLAGEPIEVIWPSEGAPGALRVVAISKHTKNPASQGICGIYAKTRDTADVNESDSTDSFFTPLAEGVMARSEREPNGAFIAFC